MRKTRGIELRLPDLENKVLQKDNWYVDDQMKHQLGAPGARFELEKRWKNFEKQLCHLPKLNENKKDKLKILDAGCGDGINLLFLKEFFKKRKISVELIGCDYNPLRISRANKIEKIKIIKADLTSLPFKDEKFDFILCSHVIEHIENDLIAISELARVLKLDGILTIAVPNEGCMMASLRNKVLQRKILKTTDHVNFYTQEKLLEKTSKANLELSGNVYFEGFFMPHLGIHTRLREFRVWQFLVMMLSKLFPSQSAGLVASFKRKHIKKSINLQKTMTR